MVVHAPTAVFRYYSYKGDDDHRFDASKIPVWRGQIKVKDEAEDVFEKIIGTENCD